MKVKLTTAFAEGKNAPSMNMPSPGPEVAPVKLSDACKIYNMKLTRGLAQQVLTPA